MDGVLRRKGAFRKKGPQQGAPDEDMGKRPNNGINPMTAFRITLRHCILWHHTEYQTQVHAEDRTPTRTQERLLLAGQGLLANNGFDRKGLQQKGGPQMEAP